jgi:hypothetical protein
MLFDETVSSSAATSSHASDQQNVMPRKVSRTISSSILLKWKSGGTAVRNFDSNEHAVYCYNFEQVTITERAALKTNLLYVTAWCWVSKYSVSGSWS